MSPPGGAAAFEQLKSLLLGETMRRLDESVARVEKLEGRVGDNEKLGAATGEVLVEAFEHAEAKRGREMSHALAPLVVSAIRAEIKNSKDMMVEALYPITGRLVTAAVGNAFRELVENLNARIDAMTSANAWRLRLRALATGRTMAEVALAEADAGRLKRALLLERGSGRAIAIWPKPEADDNVDLASGMIAAITEFASSVYADKGGELRMLDLGSSEVFLRASPRVIVAAEFGGDLSSQRESRLDEAFLSLVERHEKDEAGCDAEALGGLLNEALADEPAKPKSKTPVIVVGLIATGLAGWAAWGPVTRSLCESRIQDAYAQALVSHDRLSQFPIRVDVDHNGERVILRGLSANTEEPQAIVDAIASAAAPYRVERHVSVIALAAQADALKDGETRAAATLQEAQQQIDALRAEIKQTQDRLERGDATAQLRRLVEGFAVFFTDQENLADPAGVNAKLDKMVALIKAANANLRVVGYADELGSSQMNRAVSRRRADKVAAMLVERGVARERLALVPRSSLNPIADSALDNTRSRRVVFELPYEGEFDIK